MTDFRVCKWCRTRVIFARTAEGKKLPPANYTPDPTGQLAIQHTPENGWLGRFLARNEQPTIPENRYAVHECDGTRHHRQRKGEARATRGQHPRRRRSSSTQPTLI